VTSPSVLGKVSGAVTWTLIGKLVRFATSFVTSILIVRHLGTEDYGVLAIVRVAVAFIAIPAGVGMGQALLRFLPELAVSAAGRGGRRLLTIGAAVQVAAWGVLVLGVYLTRGHFDRFFHEEISSFLLLGTSLLLIGSLRGFFDSALIASYEARRLTWLGAAGSTVLLVLTWGFLRGGLGIPGILVAAALAEVIPVIGGAIWAFRAYTGRDLGIAPARLVTYSMPFVLLTFLNMLTWKQTETLLLGHFFSASEAGIFDVAYKLPQQILEFVPESIWALVMAAMSEAYTKNPEALRRSIDVYYRLLFFVVAPTSVFGMILGDRLITVLYGAEWAQAGVLCQLFFGIFSLTFLGTPLSMAIYVLEKSWANFLLALLFAIVNLSLDLLLIPRFGLAGAVIPVAIAIGISPLARWMTLRRFLSDVTIPWGFIGRAYLVSAPILLVLPLKRYVHDVPSLAAASLACVALVVGAMRLVGLLSRSDREMIARSNLPMKGALLRVFAGGMA
jgi:O-antigen/teichoic acid export membrane protein